MANPPLVDSLSPSYPNDCPPELETTFPALPLALFEGRHLAVGVGAGDGDSSVGASCCSTGGTGGGSNGSQSNRVGRASAQKRGSISAGTDGGSAVVARTTSFFFRLTNP